MSDGYGDALNTINRNIGIVSDNVSKGFNNVGNVLSVIDNHVDTVNDNVKVINSEVSKLAYEFAEYVKKADMQHELELAETRLGNIQQKLADDYRHQNDTRVAMIGILQANDLELVRKSTISFVTEELMVLAKGFWLAPA